MEELTAEQCPQILRVYETFEDASSSYMVTDFFKDGDLYNYILTEDAFLMKEDHAKLILR